MTSHKQLPKLQEIPPEMLRDVCLFEHQGACAKLDWSPSEGKRICAKNAARRNTDLGLSQTGTQYMQCTGVPQYSQADAKALATAEARAN